MHQTAQRPVYCPFHKTKYIKKRSYLESDTELRGRIQTFHGAG